LFSRALAASLLVRGSAPWAARRATSLPTSRTPTNRAIVPSRMPASDRMICQVCSVSGDGGGGTTTALPGTPPG